MQDSGNYEYSRQYVVGTLRRMGYRELADEASRDLPDPVDFDLLSAWAERHGLFMDDMISRMGGRSLNPVRFPVQRPAPAYARLGTLAPPVA